MTTHSAAGNTPMSPEAVNEIVRSGIEKSTLSNSVKARFASCCLIEPKSGLVWLDEFHARLPGHVPGSRVVWFVTQSDPQSVFFDERDGSFGACWGPARDGAQYVDLGYRSLDPVEMFVA